MTDPTIARRGETVQSLYFPRLTGGLALDADRLTIGPETYPSIWADLRNLVPYRGMLQRREGISAALNGPTPADGVSDDYPVLIAGLLSFDNGERFILVTTRDMWIYTNSGWSNVTPVYATGTVDVTNGSPNVTGVGTAWVDRRIAPGQPISIAGVWYTIATVPTNTSLTLTGNYAGATAAGVAYSIRRTFAGTVLRPFAACRILNGDAYVAVHGGGRYLAAAGGTIVSTGAVFRIARAADTAKGSFTGADTSILMSTDAMDATTDAIGYEFFPKGLDLLEDGRLVMSVHALNKLGAVTSFYVNNRVLFSSALDLAVWSTLPGGFYDLICGRGGITAQERLAGSIAVHFNDQVQVGRVTGSDVDPLQWTTTRADRGASGPRLLVSVPPAAVTPGGQFFVSGDGAAYVFDGDRALPVPTGWEKLIRDGSSFFMDVIGIEGHLSFDELRRSVSLWSSRTGLGGGSVSQASVERRWDLDTGIPSEHYWKNLISAVNQQRMFVHSPTGIYGRLLGVRGTDSANAGTEYLYTASYDLLNDAALPVILAGTTTNGFRAETHDLLLGAPDIESRIVRVIVWFRGRAAVTETLQCYISVDSGATWETGVGSNAIALTNVANERRAVFYFSTSAPADRGRVRITGNDPDVFSFALSRMQIDFASSANVRAVAV